MRRLLAILLTLLLAAGAAAAAAWWWTTQPLPLAADKVAALRYVAIGLIIMAIMAFRPQGLFGNRQELHLDG